MDDSHGKEISLQYVTVKVPGQKPRGSRGTQLQQPASVLASGVATSGAAPGVNGAVNDPIGAGTFPSLSERPRLIGVRFPVPKVHHSSSFSVSTNSCALLLLFFPGGLASGKEKRSDKVMLTAYEVLKEPVSRMLMGSDESSAQSGAANGADIKSETPSVKKRHRRMKSSSNKANDVEGNNRRRGVTASRFSIAAPFGLFTFYRLFLIQTARAVSSSRSFRWTTRSGRSRRRTWTSARNG